MTPAATLDSDDIHLMTKVGFIAAGRADVHHAERIFGALALARPQHDFPHVGMAAALLNAGRPADAAARLGNVQLPPGDATDMVQAFHGLALQLDRRPGEATRLLRAVAARAQNIATPSEGARLACKLLGEPPHHPPVAH